MHAAAMPLVHGFQHGDASSGPAKVCSDHVHEARYVQSFERSSSMLQACSNGGNEGSQEPTHDARAEFVLHFIS